MAIVPLDADGSDPRVQPVGRSRWSSMSWHTCEAGGADDTRRAGSCRSVAPFRAFDTREPEFGD